MLAASEPSLVDQLLLLSYPLHPPKRPGELRTGHFPRLQTPAMFVHDTRDSLPSSVTEAVAMASVENPNGLCARSRVETERLPETSKSRVDTETASNKSARRKRRRRMTRPAGPRMNETASVRHVRTPGPTPKSTVVSVQRRNVETIRRTSREGSGTPSNNCEWRFAAYQRRPMLRPRCRQPRQQRQHRCRTRLPGRVVLGWHLRRCGYLIHEENPMRASTSRKLR